MNLLLSAAGPAHQITQLYLSTRFISLAAVDNAAKAKYMYECYGMKLSALMYVGLDFNDLVVKGQNVCLEFILSFNYSISKKYFAS